MDTLVLRQPQARRAYDEKKQYTSVHMGKIVKRYKSVKPKYISKHIISVIPDVIDKYLNYVDETDTPD